MLSMKRGLLIPKLTAMIPCLFIALLFFNKLTPFFSFLSALILQRSVHLICFVIVFIFYFGGMSNNGKTIVKENLTETKERHNKPILPGKIGGVS